jgi:hypothetical protein
MFQKGNQFGKLKGKDKKSERDNSKRILSYIKLKDIGSINDLTRKVLENINLALNSTDKNERNFMTVSIAKYLFSTKKETVNVTASFEDFLKQVEKGNNATNLIESATFTEVNNLLNSPEPDNTLQE